jgi:hypothetical protein
MLILNSDLEVMLLAKHAYVKRLTFLYQIGQKLNKKKSKDVPVTGLGGL